LTGGTFLIFIQNFNRKFNKPVSGAGKVHAHGGTIGLIKLRVMSDESIARGRAMLCEIFGKGIKDKEKKHDL